MKNPKSHPRLSQPALRILNQFLQDPTRELCGAALIKVLKVPSGTLYPILLRFEQHGLLESHWESQDASDLSRPRRRMYHITAHGCTVANQALDEFTKPQWLTIPERA